MSQQPEQATQTDIPTTSSWENDWKRAEAKATEHEQGGADEHASEQEAVDSGSQGSDEDGSEHTESRSGEEGLESAPEAEDREGESDQRTEDGTREGRQRAKQQRNAPRERRERRANGSAQPQGAVDPEKLAALKAQAEELGLVVESDRVTVPDRVAFRKERRELRERLAKKETEMEERFRHHAEQLQHEYGQSLRLQELVDARDFDGLAKEIGYEDFGELSVAHVQKRMSPEQREMMQLRAELQKEKRQRQAAAEANQRAQAQRSQQREIAEYKEDLQGELLDIEDPTVADFARESSFVDMVFEVQKAHWNEQDQTTISAEEAAGLVIDELRQTYSRMHNRFGDRAASQPEKQPASEAQVAAPGRRTPMTVSQNEAADVSQGEDTDVLDPVAWERKWGARIKESTVPS